MGLLGALVVITGCVGTVGAEIQLALLWLRTSWKGFTRGRWMIVSTPPIGNFHHGAF